MSITCTTPSYTSNEGNKEEIVRFFREAIHHQFASKMIRGQLYVKIEANEKISATSEKRLASQTKKINRFIDNLIDWHSFSCAELETFKQYLKMIGISPSTRAFTRVQMPKKPKTQVNTIKINACSIKFKKCLNKIFIKKKTNLNI